MLRANEREFESFCSFFTNPHSCNIPAIFCFCLCIFFRSKQLKKFADGFFYLESASKAMPRHTVFRRIADARMSHGAGSPCYSVEALDLHGWTSPEYEIEMKRDLAHADLTANDRSAQLCASALYNEARERLIARTQYYDHQIDQYLVDQVSPSQSYNTTNEDCFDLEYERLLLMEEEIRIRQKHEEAAEIHRDCMVRDATLVRKEIAQKESEQDLDLREKTLKRCEREKEEREKAFRQAVIKKYEDQYNKRIQEHKEEKAFFANVQAQFRINARQHEISATYIRKCEESMKEQRGRFDLQLEDLVEREFALGQESKRLETLRKSLELTSKIENIAKTAQADSDEIDELKNQLLFTQALITDLESDVEKIDAVVSALHESSGCILTENRIEQVISLLEQETFGSQGCDFCCQKQKSANGCSLAAKKKADNMIMEKSAVVKNKSVNVAPIKPVALKHTAVNTDPIKPVALKHTAVNTDPIKPVGLKHTAVNTDPIMPVALKNMAINTDTPKPLTLKHTAVNTDTEKHVRPTHMPMNTEHSLPLLPGINDVNTEEESFAHLDQDKKTESVCTWVWKVSRDLFGAYFDVISMLIYKHLGDQIFELDVTSTNLSSLGCDAITALDTYAKSVQIKFEHQAIELFDNCHGLGFSGAMANYLMSVCDKTNLFLMTKSPEDLLELAKRVESSTEFQHWVFVEEYLRFFRLCMDQDTGEILSWSKNQDMINRARRHCMTDTGVYPTWMTIMRTIHQWEEEELLRFDKLYTEEVNFITRYAVREHLLGIKAKKIPEIFYKRHPRKDGGVYCVGTFFEHRARPCGAAGRSNELQG